MKTDYPDKAIEKLWSKIEKREDGCWIWIDRSTKRDARLYFDGCQVRPKRMLCDLLGIEAPPPKLEMMKCGNIACINPDHIAITDEDRLWCYVEKTDGCWLYHGPKDRDGYGRFHYSRNGKRHVVRAHRYAYTLFYGPIDDPKLCVCHSCDVRNCLRKEHLWLGTSEENTADKMQKQRQAKGAQVGSPLTEEQVKKIKTTCNLLELAERFAISPDYAYSVIVGETWKDVEP
jgi:hypothetical protein